MLGERKVPLTCLVVYTESCRNVSEILLINLVSHIANNNSETDDLLDIVGLILQVVVYDILTY